MQVLEMETIWMVDQHGDVCLSFSPSNKKDKFFCLCAN